MRPPQEAMLPNVSNVLSARFLTLEPLPCFGMAPGSTSPRDYGAGTLIIGVVAPVIMAVLAVPVWIMFFNV
jgi:hypothetical protein